MILLSTFGITLRAEYFDNEKGVVAAPGTSIFDITLSPNIKIGNLTIIPELRLDAGKDEIFRKNDGHQPKALFQEYLQQHIIFKLITDFAKSILTHESLTGINKSYLNEKIIAKIYQKKSSLFLTI